MNHPSKKLSPQIDVAVVPHPFAVRHERHFFDAGLTVAQIIARIQPDDVLAKHAHVSLDGHYIFQKNWRRVKPKAGAHMTIRMVPMGGGGGKNPLRTVLSMAIMAASPALTAGLGGYLGAAGQSFLGVSATRLITTGVNLLGRLALNAIAPPGQSRFANNKKESPSLFLQGARNQAQPFARVPKVLGKHRFVPPLGARAYTETVGNDQYLRMLFVWGYGPLQISDLKIGETPLAEFENVEIETRQGYDTDVPLTLYTDSVLQNDMDVQIRHSDGYILRTSENDADELSVDITLPQGLLNFSKSGTKKSASVQVEIQYSPAGMNDWSAGAESFKAIGAQTATLAPKPEAYAGAGGNSVVTRLDRIVLDPASGAARVITGTPFRIGIDSGAVIAPLLPPDTIPLALVERRSGDAAVIPAGRLTDNRVKDNFQTSGDFLVATSVTADQLVVVAGGLKFSGISITAKQSSALRKSVNFRVAKGQYDVRVRRLTADAVDDNTFDTTIWTSLRTLRHTQPIKMTGVAMTALRIKATDQLNGVIDRFNGVVHSILPDWNGTDWVEQVTSNPASLYRHVLQGGGNARPLADNRLDLPRIVQWHDSCAAAGREFNSIVDYDLSVREILQDIAAAGRASPTLLDGKWAVVEDQIQTVPVQHFTPHNTFGFQGQKAFDETPHALRVRFINRDKDWLQDERLVFDDGYSENTAQRYETLDLTGITDPKEAWKAGRYHIATARLRPESYSFYCDIEHIVCTRGDLVRFTHDVPMFGLAGGRIKSFGTSGGNINRVMLNNDVSMESGKNYVLRIRKKDGTGVVKALQTIPGTGRILTFAASFPPTEPIEIGNLVMFGETGQESVELIVRSIEPQNNLNARLTCVDAAPAIHTADIGLIPAFSNQISTAEDPRPPVPVLAQIQSGEESLIRNTDGSLLTRIVVTLAPPVFSGVLTTQVLIRAQDETDFHRAEISSQTPVRISITDVAEQEIYDLQIRHITVDGICSAPLLITGHRVAGTEGMPSDVRNLSMNVLGDTAYLSWTAVPDIDLDHYTLRFSPEISGASWSSAVDIVASIARDATVVSLPAASGTYFLKAVDVGDRMSVNAAAVVSTIAGLSGYNAVLSISESPDFSGAKTNTGLLDGALTLSGADTIEDWADVDAVFNTDIGNAGLAAAGSYYFAGASDLGAVYTSRLTARMMVSGLNMHDGIDTWSDSDATEFWDADTDTSLWSVSLQIRTTPDDPGGAPVWSDWAPFVVGDYAARAFEFRLLMASHDLLVTPAVSTLEVTIDMPDRIAAARGLVASSGTIVIFDRPFRETPAIAVTAQSLLTGDYYTLTDASPAGFTIEFANALGISVERTFDYLAKGYGEQN